MIKIKFFKSNNIFVGYECSGHAGYDDYGKDIVCASVSTVMQSTLLGIQQVCKVDVNMIRNDDKGYIKVDILQRMTNEQQIQVKTLLDTLHLTIQDLQEGYSKYISMEVIENVY